MIYRMALRVNPKDDRGRRIVPPYTPIWNIGFDVDYSVQYATARVLEIEGADAIEPGECRFAMVQPLVAELWEQFNIDVDSQVSFSEGRGDIGVGTVVRVDDE